MHNIIKYDAGGITSYAPATGNQAFGEAAGSALSGLFGTIGGGMYTSSNGAVRGIGSILSNGGSQVLGNFGSAAVDALTHGSSFTGAMGAGKNAVTGMFLGGAGIGGGLSMAGNAMAAIAGPKREYAGPNGAITLGMDTAYDTATSVIGSINPLVGGILAANKGLTSMANKWGMGTDAMTKTDAILGSNLLGGVANPLTMINGFGGKKTHTMGGKDFMTQEKMNNVWSAYSGTNKDYNEALTKEGKKYGAFSSGARKKANKLIDRSNMAREDLLDMNNLTLIGDIRGNNMIGQNTTAYNMNIMGYNPYLLRAGKQGTKLPTYKDLLRVKRLTSAINMKPQEAIDTVEIKEEIPSNKQGGILSAKLDWKPVIQFKEGGTMNVIPEGALHARKNNMDIEDITKKGIPVVDNNGLQLAEIEKNEIIFRKEVTDKLEELAKDGSNKAAEEAGKLLVKEIFENTDDRTGLIKETVGEDTKSKEEVAVENHEVIPKALLGLNLIANQFDPKGKVLSLETINGINNLTMNNYLGQRASKFSGIASAVNNGVQAVGSIINGFSQAKKNKLAILQLVEQNSADLLTQSILNNELKKVYNRQLASAMGDIGVQSGLNMLDPNVLKQLASAILMSMFLKMMSPLFVKEGGQLELATIFGGLNDEQRKQLIKYLSATEQGQKEFKEGNPRDPSEPSKKLEGGTLKFDPNSIKSYQDLVDYMTRTGRKTNEDYDLESAYNDPEIYNEWVKEETEHPGYGHWRDKYKKPSHMTFSDESVYNVYPNDIIGGTWSNQDGQDIFVVSPYLLKQHSLLDYMDYFNNYEPEAAFKYAGKTYNKKGLWK